MLLIRSSHQPASEECPATPKIPHVPALAQRAPSAPTLEQTVSAWHEAGQSQRAIARELSIDRRKIKQIIEKAA